MTALVPQEREYALTRDQVRARRAQVDADVWLFIKWVCRHGEKAVEAFHRPLAYMLAGDAVRLAASLNAYESEFTVQVKAELVRRGIDWNTKRGVRELASLLRRVNNRISRSTGKTTIGLDVMLWLASRDPDISIGIASKSDPAAWKFCGSIGNIMRSPEYATYYPDRLYLKAGGGFDTDSYITIKWIRMNGRRKPVQETIEARGINSQWTSCHYDVIYPDDIVGTESGEASQEDAKRFIAALPGISMPDEWGGSRYVFNGTIYGPKDDHAALCESGVYLTTVIPIWKRSVRASLSNIHTDGVPVLPEFYGLDSIRAKRSETMSNPLHGPISWLQNFELTAHEEGALQFSQDLLRRSRFQWVTYRSVVNGVEKLRRVIRRYLWTADDTGALTPLIDNSLPSKGACGCWMACGKGNHARAEYDPLTLPRVIGVDQALALKGDKWSIAVIAQDPQGFKYALKGKAGKGYRNMIPAIPYVFNLWGGSSNPPRKVGIESNAWQAITADWLQRDESFRFLARRIEKVSPGQTQKELRIFNNVLANLEMGTLLLDPEDTERDSEMLRYNAAADNPEDNILDSMSIAVTLFGQPAEMYSEDERVKDERRAEEEYFKNTDPETGIDLSSDFMDAAW